MSVRRGDQAVGTILDTTMSHTNNPEPSANTSMHDSSNDEKKKARRRQVSEALLCEKSTQTLTE